MSKACAWRAVLAPAVLSLVLNTAGIHWGLPARWHPDEKADAIARMARGSGLAPESFVNPSFPLYVQLPFVWAQQQARNRGLPDPWGDPLLLCRFLSALAGAGAVLILGILSARIAPGQRPWPAWFLAVAPGFVNLCHFATPEAWLLLGCAATLLLSVEHAAGRAPAWLLGLVLGLTVSTKYTGAALLAPAVAAVWLRPRPLLAPRNDRPVLLAAGGAAVAAALAFYWFGPAIASRLHLKDARLLHPETAAAFVDGLGRSALLLGVALVALALLGAWPRTAGWAARLARREVVIVGVLALVGFFVGTPFAATEPLAFLSDLAFNAQTRAEYKGLVGERTSLLAYLTLLGDAMTWPLVAAAAIGLGFAFTTAHREPTSLILLLGAVVPYVLVASSGHRAMRFLAPMLPAVAFLAARGISSIIPSRRAASLVRGAVFARAALASVLVIRLFFKDSRQEAERWMESHVPAGATVDLIANHVGYAPRLPEGRVLRLVPTLSREMAPKERFVEAAARYPEEASAWLILTASFYERFLEHPDQQPERARFFGDLLAGRGAFEVAARFRQQGFWRPEVEFVDPEIVILRKRP